MATKVFGISGMHCGACVGRVRGALERVSGVRGAVVTLDPPRGKIESEREISEEELGAAVRGAGSYEVIADQAETGEDRRGPAGYPKREAAAEESLWPLVCVVVFIAGTVGLTTWVRGGHHDGAGFARVFMNDFMAGFFIVFSFFKVLDLRGFVSAYRMYDLVARAVPPWAWVYPFVELGLGAAYLTRWQPGAVNVATIVLMLVGAAGVFNALRQKRAIRCACLGTALKLPMTTVTLVEDLGMAGMAGAMLVIGQ